MTDYLTRLSARSLGLPGTLEPRLVSLYEPVGNSDGPPFVDGPASGTSPALKIGGAGEASAEPASRPANHRRPSAPPPAPDGQRVVPGRLTPPLPGPGGRDADPRSATADEGRYLSASLGSAAESSGDDRRPGRHAPTDTAVAPADTAPPFGRADALRPPRDPVLDAAGTVAPTVHVTIGRVEVRALVQATPSTPPREAPGRRGASLSLADYLRQRNAERR